MNIEKIIVVGSLNDVKVSCVRKVLKELDMLKYYTVVPHNAASGVPDQPMDRETILAGAKNRALDARDKKSGGTVFLGIESGIYYDDISQRFMDISYTYGISSDGRRALSASAQFEIPDKVMELVRQGKDLNTASCEYYQMKDVGSTVGISGIVSKYLVPRNILHFQPTAFVLAKLL